jgi:Kef-type K+ transport system membrane component KefB
MDLFISLAVALLAGLFLSRLARVLNLPAVTAYLVAGVLLGPFVLGALANLPAFSWLNYSYFINAEKAESLQVISKVALGFIAFTIGNEFRVSSLKNIGRQALVVGTVQAVATTVVVDIALVAFHFIFPDVLSLTSAILLGAVAAATAPATTMMVVQQYKAKGKLTSMLLPIVALDDAVGLVVFAISYGVGEALQGGEVDVISIVLNPFIEIAGSLLLGLLVGLLFTWSERFFHSRAKRLSMSVAFVLLTVGISMLEIHIGRVTVAFSSLLSCMMLGTIFCNICDFSSELMDRLDRWTAPIYILFFVCSGASLDLSVFKNYKIVCIGLAYVVFRMIGKYYGNYFSAGWVHCDVKVKKNIGIAMFPQEGVALGMASIAAAGLGSDGAFVKMITLFGVLIFELFSPMLSKFALIRSGDITTPVEEESVRGKTIPPEA